MNDPNESKLLKFRDAAERLGIGYSTLGRIVSRGEIGVVRPPNRHPRIRAAELAAYIERSTKPAIRRDS